MADRRKSGLSRRALLAGTGAVPVVGRAKVRANTVDVLRPPDLITAFTESDAFELPRSGSAWAGRSVVVEAEPRSGELPVRITAPGAALLRVRLRWLAKVPETWRMLGDHWERSYGDLEWRGMVSERILPWYFLAFDGKATQGYGVATGARAFCFWQVDPAGVSLWLDVRNGGSGVRLGERTLQAAIIRTRQSEPGEEPFAAAREFCHLLCSNPRLPAAPVYGSNNWYYTYGQNFSAEDILKDSDLIASLSPSGGNRPFMVIDDGWQSAGSTRGPWDRGNANFPNMPGLAAEMKRRGVRPGIWVRPLYTSEASPESWRMPYNIFGPKPDDLKFVLDPSVPEVIEHVNEDMRRAAAWGFEMIKHDFTTYDILGRWGFAMNADLTNDGWHFADRSRTTAEIVLGLYSNIRQAAGSALLIGCNTVGHLGAGFFELQRIGDDTSGREFHRTRRMGVNTLAFRMAQHGQFFAADADCAPVTSRVPWEMASRWLDLVARSGTPLFVSPDPRVVGPEQKQALARALAQASRPQPPGEPLDWMETTTPARWRLGGDTVEYDWFGREGSTPFPR